MDRDELKGVFEGQKERMRLAIQELSVLRDTLEGSRRAAVEETISLLQDSLEVDERTSARL